MELQELPPFGGEEECARFPPLAGFPQLVGCSIPLVQQPLVEAAEVEKLAGDLHCLEGPMNCAVVELPSSAGFSPEEPRAKAQILF